MQRSSTRINVLLGHLSPSQASAALSASPVAAASTAGPVPTDFYTPVGAIGPLVKKLHDTFALGKTRRLEWRRSQLQAVLAMMQENSVALCKAVQDDLSRSKFETQTLEVTGVINQAKLALDNLSKWTQPERHSAPIALQPAECLIVREPLGVISIISAWNAPIVLVFLPLIGAIAAGNCAVVKPSELSANTAKLVGKLITSYLDPEAFAVVQGAVEETQALLDAPVDHIMYTGGPRVARSVLEKAAKHLTPVTLELGGKNPVIVDKHANLEVAARRIVWGRTVNAGQICIAPDYALIHKDVEEAFCALVKKYINEFFGSDPKTSHFYARIVNQSHFKRLKNLLDDEPSKRGEILVGGATDEAAKYIAPTFLRNTQPDSRVMQDEIFGPILPMMKINDLDEAIKFINARPKPLALYLFSSSKESQQKVLSSTSSGTVGLNECIMQYICPNLPFGGVGASGYGKYIGIHSFNLFSNARAILDKSDSSILDVPARYPPFTPAKKFIMKKVL